MALVEEKLPGVSKGEPDVCTKPAPLCHAILFRAVHDRTIFLFFRAHASAVTIYSVTSGFVCGSGLYRRSWVLAAHVVAYSGPDNRYTSI